MEGGHTESVWGVMDIVPITNFRQHDLHSCLRRTPSDLILSRYSNALRHT